MLVSQVILRTGRPTVQFSIWTWGDTKLAMTVLQEDFLNYYAAVIANLNGQWPVQGC